jgi:iron complex outermembrane receptor protein
MVVTPEAGTPIGAGARRMAMIHPKSVRPGRAPIAGARTIALCLILAAAFPARGATDLTQMSLEELLQVKVVTASKYEQKQNEVAAAVSVITREEILAFGWRTLEEAMASLPGVFVTYDRQYTYVGLRGFGLPGDYNTRVLVTINGNRVNEPTFDTGPFGRQLPLDMDLVERIEFIPGPGGAVYGQNAMFGVINIVTRNGAAVDGTELAASYKTPQALREGRATWGKALDNGTDVLLSVSGMTARGQDLFLDYGSAGVSGTAGGLDGERDAQFFAHVARGAWSFDFEHGDRRKDDPTGSYLSDPLAAGQYQGDRYELAQLQFQDRFARDTLNVLGRLFTGQYQYSSILRYGTWFSYPATGAWHGGELRLVSSGLAGHTLMAGLEGQYNTHQDQAVLDLANPGNDIVLPGSGYRVGLYGQDEWRIAQALTATIGVRLDRNDVTGNALSPRAALIWQATPATSFKALYGQGHRAPNAGECCYDDGVGQVANHALKGETIDTLELVADHRVARDLTVRGSVYHWTMRDQIQLGIDPVSGLPQYQSGDTVRALGAELSADQTWQWGARLRGSVSYQDAGYVDGAPLLNSPRWLGKLNFNAPLPGARLHLGYEFRYDSKRLSESGIRLGGYALSNVYLIADQWVNGLTVSLGILNLFDKNYAQPAADTNWQNALEQDGRSARIRLSYRF